MLKMILTLSAIFMMPLSAQAMPASTSKVNFTSATIPGGFGPDDHVFAVVSGIYPNSCYSWNGASVDQVNDTTFRISGVANVTQGMCMMVLVPFQEEVMVGQLGPGEYTLQFDNGEGTYFEHKLKIEPN